MQALIFRPGLPLRARIVAVLAGLVLVGVLVLGAQSASATSLISTGQMDADDERTAAEPMNSVMLVDAPLSRSQLFFLKDNFVQPVYSPDAESLGGSDTGDDHGLDLPWGEDPIAY